MQDGASKIITTFVEKQLNWEYHWRSSKDTEVWEQDWTLILVAKSSLGEMLRWQRRLRTLAKAPEKR